MPITETERVGPKQLPGAPRRVRAGKTPLADKLIEAGVVTQEAAESTTAQTATAAEPTAAPDIKVADGAVENASQATGVQQTVQSVQAVQATVSSEAPAGTPVSLTPLTPVGESPVRWNGKVLSIEPDKPCLSCGHLVRGAAKFYDNCHYSKGNKLCPAQHVVIEKNVNVKKAARAIANAVNEGDLEKLLGHVSKMWDYHGKGLLSPAKFTRIMQRAAQLYEE